MRKFFATTLVALVALTMVLAAVGCGQKTDTSTTETTPAVESPPMDTTSMMADTAMTDTSAHH
jgi:hypothetical protein